MAKAAKKILIVEDEDLLVKALKTKLKFEGFRVLVADNGQKGLELALAEKPDLILLDIIMPVMDGLTMMEKLRESSVGKKINIIILTNLTYLDDDDQVSKYNVSDYLVKSKWKLSDLIQKIKLIVK